MALLGLLIVMLTSPVAVIVVFAGLALSAGVTYMLSDVAQHGQPWEAIPDGPAARMPWWRVQQHLWRHARARGTKRVVTRAVTTLFMVGFAGATGALVAGVVALPFDAIPLLIRRPAIPEAPLIPIAGALLSVFSVAKCLRYVTGRATRRRPLRGPEFRLTDRTVALRDRVEFNRKIYLYTQLQWAARAASIVGPALAISSLVQAASTIQPATPSSTVAWSPQNVIGFLAFISYLALAIIVAGRLDVAIAVVLSPVHAAIAVHRCLGITEDEGTDTTVGWARDPLGDKRNELDHAVLALTRAGQRLDRASKEHPLASVILACAHYIHNFLKGHDALTARYPTQLPEILTTVLAVLAGPTNPQQAATLASLVEAFDDNGQPKTELRTAQTGRWALLLGRAGDSLDRYSRIATAIWVIFSFAVVIFLIATRRLDLSTFQLQK